MITRQDLVEIIKIGLSRPGKNWRGLHDEKKSFRESSSDSLLLDDVKILIKLKVKFAQIGP